jgi:hypothetical protein
MHQDSTLVSRIPELLSAPWHALFVVSPRKWLGMGVVIFVVGALVGAFLPPTRTFVVHAAGSGQPTWADVTTAVATVVLTLTTLGAAVVAYVEYKRRRDDAKELAVSRCDPKVKAQCFAYQGFHLVRVEVELTNRSTSRLQFSTAAYSKPAFVILQAVQEDKFVIDDPILTTMNFDDDDILALSPVLAKQWLESAETLTDACLIPIQPPKRVAAYRVEFAVEILEPSDNESYEWSAVTFVPVTMTSVGP